MRKLWRLMYAQLWSSKRYLRLCTPRRSLALSSIDKPKALNPAFSQLEWVLIEQPLNLFNIPTRDYKRGFALELWDLKSSTQLKARHPFIPLASYYTQDYANRLVVTSPLTPSVVELRDFNKKANAAHHLAAFQAYFADPLVNAASYRWLRVNSQKVTQLYSWQTAVPIKALQHHLAYLQSTDQSSLVESMSKLGLLSVPEKDQPTPSSDLLFRAGLDLLEAAYEVTLATSASLDISRDANPEIEDDSMLEDKPSSLATAYLNRQTRDRNVFIYDEGFFNDRAAQKLKTLELLVVFTTGLLWYGCAKKKKIC